MKITPQIKESPTFIFAKMKGLNNREAARFWTILSEGINSKRCDDKAVDVYLRICKEPKVNVIQYEYSIENEGNQKKSRSKLVMEYEKHRKAFLKINEARKVDGLLDAIVSEQYDKFVSSDNIRYSVLAALLLKISR